MSLINALLLMKSRPGEEQEELRGSGGVLTNIAAPSRAL